MNYDYCDGMIYAIKKGDTLYSISRSKQVPLSMLLRANPYVDVYNLQVGDTICIPVRQRPCAGEGADMQAQPGCAGGSSNMPMQPRCAGGSSNMPAQQGCASRGDSGMADYMQEYANGTEKPAGEVFEEDMVTEYVENVSNEGSVSDGNEMNFSGQITGRSAAENGTVTEYVTETGEDMTEGSFVRYVTQPGDTLADVLAHSDSDKELFWSKNPTDRIHLLPGISYIVFEEEDS